MVPGCIFCEIVAGRAPAWRVHETAQALAFFDVNPVGPYHTLVVPKRHYAGLFDVPRDQLLAVTEAVKDVVDLYHAKLGLENIQLVQSTGCQAQQDVFHLHVHIVPRQRGDGQDIHWVTHPELRPQFDHLLERLR